jgi:hypothetical protein
MTESEQPIFVVGRPRSGTTLMASLLDAHPRISILAIETEIFHMWYGIAKEFDLHQPDDFQRFWSLFVAKSRFEKLDVTAEQIVPPPDRREPLAAVSYILSRTGQIDAGKLNKVRWGEKTPHHYKYLGLLFEAYPEARVVMMLRDPRAVLASVLKAPWNKEAVEQCARNWNEFVAIMRRWSSDQRIYIVSYENLTKGTEDVLRKLCQWLEEEYTPAMLDRSHLTHRLKTKKNWGLEHRRKALGPITVESIDKWRSELTEHQLMLTEHICGNLMRELNYETETNGLRFPLNIIYDSKHRLSWRIMRLRRLIKEGLKPSVSANGEKSLPIGSSERK